jgi:hypothetical protein
MGTNITDSGAQAVLALRSMEANAFRLSQVTTRLLDEHTDLPDLLAVRPHAEAHKATLDLQPRTLADARLWAAALEMELEVEDLKDPLTKGWHHRRATAKAVIQGVTVFVVTSESYTAKEWAELVAAEAVSA